MINDAEINDTIALASVEVALREFEKAISDTIDKFERDVRLGNLQAEKARLEATLCLCHPPDGGGR